MSLVAAIEAVAHTYNRKSAILSFLIKEWVAIILLSGTAVWIAMTNEHLYHELIDVHVSTITTAPLLIVLLGFVSGYLVMKEEEVSGIHQDVKMQGIKIVLTWLVLSEWFVLAGYLLDWTFHFSTNGWAFTAFFTIAIITIRIAFQEGGDLYKDKKILPVIMTLGGVIVPAAIYLALAHLVEPSLRRDGWPTGTPTDIAFATTLMVLAVYKDNTAPAIVVLLAVAVLDDLIGIGIIALWFSRPDIAELFWASMLLIAGFVLTYFMAKYEVRNFLAYLLVPGQLHWWAFYVLGVEPAIGMIFIIFMMPIDKPKAKEEHHIMSEHDEDLEKSHKHTKPVHVMAEVLERPVIFIVGAFALVNAGVRIESDSFGSGFYLVWVSLVIGKPLGIVGFTLVGMKLFKLPLPDGVGVRDLIVVGIFAGMGFTVSLFITETAFDDEAILAAHKAGAMAATITAFALGFAAAKIMGVKPYQPPLDLSKEDPLKVDSRESVTV